MKKIFTPCRALFLTLTGLWAVVSLEAQVFPGDANFSGRVDNLDILYVGYAYGTIGPHRLTDDVAFAEQSIPLLWDEYFPDGINYAFADADGNGLVHFPDFTVIFFNYEQETDDIVEPTFFLGDPAVDPQMALDLSNVNNITAGSVVDIPIILGTPNLPISDLNGIAFTLQYDPDLISDITIDFHHNSWLNAGNQLFCFQHNDMDSDGRIDVGLSRFGVDPVSGEGEIGVVSIVIEEDLVDLLPTDSAELILELIEIKAIDDLFSEIIIAGDEASMMVYHPNALVGTPEPKIEHKVQVFPNPASRMLQIHSNTEIERIELLDLFGQVLGDFAGTFSKSWQIPIAEYGEGIRLVKVYSTKGVASKKVLVQTKS